MVHKDLLLQRSVETVAQQSLLKTLNNLVIHQCSASVPCCSLKNLTPEDTRFQEADPSCQGGKYPMRNSVVFVFQQRLQGG